MTQETEVVQPTNEQVEKKRRSKSRNTKTANFYTRTIR